MKIKVCGLRDKENIRAVAALNPDFMGFIFYGRSPRFANELSAEALNNIPARIHKTGVFVNDSAENITKLINKYNFEAVQLHGNESPEFCESLLGKATVIKAFGVDENFDFEALNEFTSKVDYFLFDTKTKAHGGSGKTFNWAIVNQYKLNNPFFLSGGLSPDNIEEVKNINHPQFYGVDLNSKFETAPGLKNIEQLQQAFNIILNKAYTNELRS